MWKEWMRSRCKGRCKGRPKLSSMDGVGRALRGRSGFLEIVFVGQCEVLVCL